jgi:phosphoribosylformylglycinamidine synthase II
VNESTTTPRHRELGLTDDEAERIPELIGREPTDPELVMFSLMWSEHCSYKHSKLLLRGLPTKGPGVLQGPGENAGLVDVGDGLAVAFKIESHNHPSAVEPFEGAATGVGGIVRDVLAMGARPIALLDALRFGELDSPRSRHLFTQAVAGIAHYGNCIGVPTVGGEIGFDDCYEESCLVNAMCVGVVEHNRTLSAAAKGPGNAVVLIGNRTGRDGIGGASVLASAELDADQDLRPSVQVSDPFTERKLIDCCLSLADDDLLVSLQDLGAAGLTSASSEMAAKGGLGLDLDLDKIPLREPLEAAEILVSESQERMLAVVLPADVERVLATCSRWELEAEVIGEVTDTGRLVARHGGEVVADLPARALADDAPQYTVPIQPAPDSQPIELGAVPEPPDLANAWLGLLRDPNVGSPRWIYQRYDHLVGANTVVRPGGDAAVVRLPNSDRAIAVATDGTERHCQVDPRAGGAAAVLDAARNVACTGARPIGATDCLNFGNPEKGATGWRLREVIAGMSGALDALGIAVVSGNVSLYNESSERIVHPTPIVGVVGVLDSAEQRVGHAFANEGETVLLVGYGEPRLDASAYLGTATGRPPASDPIRERALVDTLVAAAKRGLLASAHHVSDGGVAVALTESAVAASLGASLEIPSGRRADEDLFGEGGGRVLVSAAPDSASEFESMLPEGISVLGRGRVEGDEITILQGAEQTSISVAKATSAYEAALPEALA